MDPLVQIYGQGDCHDEAFICGSEAGLRALGEALIAAADSGQSKVEAFVSDGEGYDIHVLRRNYQQMLGVWFPYHDLPEGMSRNPDGKLTHPAHLIDREEES
tara:strand:- start:5111 stop:5416 length:306 start_codon:yes stop_codon:yes gene_type:complete